MCLSGLVDQFLAYCRHERGLAKTSCRDFHFYLHRFLRWLEANGHPAPTLTAFATPILRRYFHSLSAEGLRPRTLRASFYPLRSFGDWLVAGEVLDANSAKAITLPKKDAPHRPLVADDDLLRLFEAVDRQADPRQIALSRAILSVIVYGGLRRSECLALRTEDVRRDIKGIRVLNGKGGNSRTVYPCDDCLVALSEWLAVRGDCEHNYLFALNRRQRVGHKALKSMLDDLAARAGMAGNTTIKPHAMRRAAATRLGRNGASLLAIQAFLGHKSSKTTSDYLQANENMAREVADLGALKPKRPVSEPNCRSERFQRLRRRAR